MAISRSSYSVGNRVYRGGSSAPTQGTVDPMGYIDRELNNMASQQRSGLAAAALRRLSPIQRAQQGSRQLRGRDDYTLKPPPGSPNSGAYGLDVDTRSGPSRGIGVTNALDSALNPRLNPHGQAPSLQMSAIGKLQVPNLSASAGGTGLPFDPEAADAQQGLMSMKNRFELEATEAQQALERDYVTQRRSVENAIPDERRRLLENYAGRGLAYSSGYAHDTGSLESQYANLLAELEGGKTEGLANLLRQRGMFNEEWATRLQAIQAAAARRLAAQAGDLGLGGADTTNTDILDNLFGGGQAAVNAPGAPSAPAVPAAPGPVHGPGPSHDPAPAPAPIQLGIPGSGPATNPSSPFNPQPTTPIRLDNPALPPSHTNPILTAGQVQSPNMINGGDPGMRGGKTIAEIIAEQAQFAPRPQATAPAPARFGPEATRQITRPNSPYAGPARRRLGRAF